MIDKDMVIVELKKLTPDQPLRDCTAYEQWREQEETKAEVSAQKQIEFIIEDARLRRDAGLIDRARDAYKQALVYATQLGEERLIPIIEDEMRALPV
jgi:hypothetical protein